ncbi:MAG: DNRLRE domain-containing protein [Phycisphaerales bacterium]
MRLIPHVAAVACLTVCAPSLFAQEQVSLFPRKDASLFEPDLPTAQLSGGGGQLFVGRTGSGRIRRAMMQFDVAGAVPAGATITAVELQLTVNQTNAGPAVTTLHRMLADWGEGDRVGPGGGAGGAAAVAGDATWAYRFFPNEAWTNLGGDFDTAVLASKSMSGVGSYVFSGAELTAAVADMLADPDANFGIVAIGDEVNGITAKRIASRENATESSRPLLTITYTPGCIADWNHDGAVDGDDVIAFFSDWDANNADADGSGGTDGDDVIAFFGQWDTNCT